MNRRRKSEKSAWRRHSKELLDYAHESGVLPEDSVVFRDLFDTRLMNCLMPRPSEVVPDVLGAL